ncbi:hypothetical protein OG331_50105 [Streptomyces sp. NBC_01017]|uniref:hypothetical protein n=1 Tax=Streptomyces sp. NBC_01017 TaxID=2903721 RepID=UPI00386442E6|nr:hypothetical protein OG331_01870 [Streptomyces sp. NBC_01017]WSV35105.1 hypothetical protein OG331_50105 [Streptomyces sp. NBC_01017]
MKRWQRTVRPLPLRARPMQDESVVSFVMRLAAANDFPPTLLFRIIGDCVPGKHVLHRDAILNAPAIDRLGIVSRTPADHLRRALPGLSHTPAYVPLPVATPTVRFFRLPYPMLVCRTCTLQHGPATAVAWEHRERDYARYVCTTHRRWINSIPQFHLTAAPEIVTAQHEYDHLAARYDQSQAFSGLFQAWNVTSGWLQERRHTALLQRWTARALSIGATGPGSAASRFPEMIQLAELLVDPDWRSHVGLSAAWRLRAVYRYTAHAIGTDYEVLTADNGRDDSLCKWVKNLRSHYASRAQAPTRRACSLRGIPTPPLPKSRHLE